jgi:hypothetical protein
MYLRHRKQIRLPAIFRKLNRGDKDTTLGQAMHAGWKDSGTAPHTYQRIMQMHCYRSADGIAVMSGIASLNAPECRHDGRISTFKEERCARPLPCQLSCGRHDEPLRLWLLLIKRGPELCVIHTAQGNLTIGESNPEPIGWTSTNICSKMYTSLEVSGPADEQL